MLVSSGDMALLCQELDSMPKTQLVNIRIELIGQVADLLHAAEIAVHGLDALEGYHFRTVRIVILQKGPQVIHVIVTEHAVISARTANALDHRGMIELIGIDDQVFHDLAECRQGRVVGHIAGGEEQCRFLIE